MGPQERQGGNLQRLTGTREAPAQAFMVGQVCLVFFSCLVTYYIRTVHKESKMAFMFLSLCDLMRGTGVG
jgi:hypothetical protein